ncbi:zinc metallopeptidase [Siminovitchia sp. FSL H7-0308]|uniref:Zn-dependent membrane protease YugP n=1 Tax=Siminovitchia thermophila TaxID=1245522 RepID=A0ABS2R3A8_9BACI|nr:zinc metallopeptidase [Siminovitchia thermophila]MBM7713619.1 Zn-dependent membrane protease YugP [Siminovitchia thermophila]ONK21914.1 Zn-dependent protease [Bacillus sp. VT-16-64]
MGGYLMYFLLIIIIPIWAQFRVQSTYKKFAKIPTTAGITGAEVARKILDANGLYNVQVKETPGVLSDHYNPITKSVHLSSDNFHRPSVAGAAVAAHEVGHAIQDQQGYAPLRFRHALVPVANISSNIAWIFIIIGLLSTAFSNMLLIGIVLMAAGVLFQLVTLPVEFNASSRAMDQIVSLGLISNSEERDARKVLNAAAMTYVAAAAVAVLELLRLILIFTNRE